MNKGEQVDRGGNLKLRKKLQVRGKKSQEVRASLAFSLWLIRASKRNLNGEKSFDHRVEVQ